MLAYGMKPAGALRSATSITPACSAAARTSAASPRASSPTSSELRTDPGVPTARQAKSILNRPLDALFGGGLSILILLPILIFKGEWLDRIDPVVLLLLTVLVNTPHLASSFWLVYRSPELVRRHPWAAVRVPALLFGVCLLALAVSRSFHAGVNSIVLASTLYLAWHYTGQAWGMMATFATLEGAPFDATERSFLRGSLRILLVWHVVFALRIQASFPELARWMNWTEAPASGLFVLTVIVGAVGFVRWSRRQRRFPPIRVLVPWLAILCWYSVLALHPQALQVVQFGHALQYLPFPLRVKMNQMAGKPAVSPMRFAALAGLILVPSTLALFLVPQIGHAELRWEMSPAVAGVTGVSVLLLLFASVCVLWPKPWSPEPRTFLWGIAMLQAGILMYGLAPALLKQSSSFFPGGSDGTRDAANLLIAFINIHHYFTDGCAWKISTVEVRRELFAHLARFKDKVPAQKPEPT
jgi:hypothetical protein